MDQNDLTHLRTAIAVAQRAREHGNHPFGAVLVDADGRVLLEAENTVNTGRDATGQTSLAGVYARQWKWSSISGSARLTVTNP